MLKRKLLQLVVLRQLLGISTMIGLVLAGTGEWKPTSSVTVTEEVEKKAPWTARRVFNILSWVLIALSVVGFFVAMWMPRMWLIVTVSVLFAVGVFSLFFTTGKEGSNALLDANGTAR